MPRFFVPTENVSDGKIIINGGDAMHITRSLRMTRGERLTVCDSSSTEYECVISDISADTVTVDILSQGPSQNEPPYKVTLFQALPKSDKMETIVQKSVEAGVYDIVPFISERCISRPDEKGKKNKVERWNKISESAAKQCGRGVIPKVSDIISFEDALEKAASADTAILLYEDEKAVSLKKLLKQCGKDASISIIVGAEGGFSAEEAKCARAHGILSAGLGPRILRCETAPVVTLAAISYELEL